MNTFTHKGVFAKIDEPEPNLVVIYDFFSKNPGKGEAKEALQELKKTYGKISVTDIGPPEESSYQFWMHCLQNQLVDYVYDETGQEHALRK